MKRMLRSLILLALLTVLYFQAFPQAGTLDNTFGNNGIVLYNYATDYHDNTFGVHVYEDTSILVCGLYMDFNYLSTGNLQKFLPDGSIDMSWGTNGMVTFQFGPAGTIPYSMEVLPDGKILVSGTTYVSAPDAEFFVARFNPDGSPDLTFNNTGVWIGAYAADEDICYGMAIQTDGKIVLAGRSGTTVFNELLFARLNSNGTLDTDFGTNGYTAINSAAQNENLFGVDLMSDGTIIGVGYTHLGDPWYGEFAIVVKLDANGDPYPGFGTNGVLIPSVYTNYSQALDCEIVNDSIIISSYMENASGFQQLAVTKLDQDGNPDPDFGNGGISILAVNQVTLGYEIRYWEDNKFYICGTSGYAGMLAPRDFILARYNYDGTIDNSFNGNGYVITSIQSSWDDANALDFGPDGKIVLAGFSSGYSSTGDNDRAIVRYLNDYAPPAFNANFSASPTTVCEGNSVNFTDLSLGSVVSWDWTFEGGDPATSSLQNPAVTYNTTGSYDVKLVISDGAMLDSLTMTDYINVVGATSQPGMPAGATSLCGTNSTEYTTNSVQYATSYVWTVTPADAGTITGSDTVGVFQSSDTWTGNYTVKVRAANSCGNSPWSDELQCELLLNPTIYTLEGDGSYCTGSAGAELSLDNSQLDVEYELYKDGVPTGNIVSGTGSSVSFGFIDEDGLYTCVGSASICQENMVGQVFVHGVTAPGQPSAPTGPDMVCDNEISTYTTEADPDVDTYTWTLTPANAGTMETLDNTATITWNKGFNSQATLSVMGSNPCGDSPESEELTITVSLSPDPAITGETLVCNDVESNYITQDNAGSSYTWEVSGGIIVSGSGTNEVSILWGNPGQGWVSVTEENNNGCIASTEEYAVTIDDCTGIIDADINLVSIYPNPASSDIKINLPEGDHQVTEIRIINSFGTIMQTRQENGSKGLIEFNISDLRNGLYYVQLLSEGKIFASGKFIVLH